MSTADNSRRNNFRPTCLRPSPSSGAPATNSWSPNLLHSREGRAVERLEIGGRDGARIELRRPLGRRFGGHARNGLGGHSAVGERDVHPRGGEEAFHLLRERFRGSAAV